MKVLIKNVTILTMDENKTLIENGYVTINGSNIDDLGNMEELSGANITDFDVIDGSGKILIPGMINAHTHTPMVVFRSLGDDIADRLKRYIFPLEKNMVDEELVYKGSKYGIAEMLLGGVTTFCNSYYYQEYVARATSEMGMRGILAETIINFPSPDSDIPYGGLKHAEMFIRKWAGSDLITPALGPHAPYTVDAEHLIKCNNISKEYNVPFTMHVAEMDYEQTQIKKEYNKTVIQYLDSIGVLNDRFIAAHVVNVDDKDLDIIMNRDVGVSHNMGANSKGAKGVAPILKMIDRNIKLGLGTDGAMSGNTLDILTQMPLVAKVHKLSNMDRTILPSDKLLELATIGGARALGIDRITGSIEKGKRADLVLIETDSVNMFPIYDYYSTIVYAANPSNIDTVFVNGKMLVNNKKLVNDNLSTLRKDLTEIKSKIDTYFI